MTHITPTVSHIGSDLTILNPELRPIQSIVTFLTERLSAPPCQKILSFLRGRDLLTLRLVSRLSDAENAALRLLSETQVKFRVDLSGPCITAMPSTYLALGWRSISFVKDVDLFKLLEPLELLSDFIVDQQVNVEDLTIDLSTLYPALPERENLFSDDESSDVLSDDELDDGQIPEEVNSDLIKMYNLFAPFFQETLNSLVVRTSNQQSSGLLTNLLYRCFFLKKLDLSNQNGFINWIEEMNEEDLHQIFHSVEELDLSYRRLNWFDQTLPFRVLRAVLASCTSLKVLVLEGCRFISEVVQALTPDQIQTIFGKLDALYLTKSNITPAAFTSILLSHPPLRALGLSECETLSDFDSATFDFEKLEFLDLTGLSMKAKRLNALLASCANLKQLCLAGCYESLEQITFFAPDQLSAIFGQMEDLMLTGTYTSKHALETVLFACKSLTRLSLGACHNLPAVLEPLTDEQIHSVFGQLKYLDLLQIEEKSTLQLQRLLAQISHLEYLCLDSSPWGKSLLEELDEEAITRLLGNVKYLSLGYMDLSPNAYQKIRRALPNVRL